ncbi:hypothetical protein [Asanoa iriomotensis]|uniref:Uncharacterized protein n=1 Tax=Asanoa iriomotensis TaxID=234613 RepID=A0ABQ4CDK8_9ACTN|nr:hypothetical protein [Asanoa iriomotensis]GIF60854.1 hypothetical protein Air01nite_69490 [Asanoa iriomotensis]
MGDALDHLAAPAGELLARVDDLLARFGAPDDDPVWPLLRRVRALPGEAVAALTETLRAAPVATAGADLRSHAAAYADAQAVVTTPVAWEGPAGEAYAAHAARLSADLAAAGDALAAAGRLADDTAAWIGRTRSRLAGVLADALASAEAVAVVLHTDDAPAAAATIATRVLSALDAAIAEGENLPQPIPAHPAPATMPPPANYERVTRLPH